MDVKKLLADYWGLTDIELYPIESGLINATTKVQSAQGHFVLQSINRHVFPDPITLHAQLLRFSSAFASATLEKLQFVPASANSSLVHVGDSFFRLVSYIPSRTITHPSIEQARQAILALQEFHAQCAAFDTKDWQEPIPGFLAVAQRVQAFQLALLQALPLRKQLFEEANLDVSVYLMQAHNWALFLESAPIQLIHADPKCSNFLVDLSTNHIRALIDWDTLMLGSVFYDYADLIRSFCSKGEEVSTEGTLFLPENYEAIVANLHGDASVLQQAVLGVVSVQGLRFLSDFLVGDVYYTVKDAQHNWRRACNQFRLATEMQDYFTTHMRAR
ncbi:MAG: hypothetical protein RLZZ301_1668 [Bacteroidota bacterium]